MAGTMTLSAAARHRWSVTLRVIAGTLGTYAVTVLITVAASLLLARIGMNRVEAVTAATLASFAVFAVICMAVFHAGSVLRAWLWLIGTAAVLGPVVLLMRPDMA
jgi:hypothetical protein